MFDSRPTYDIAADQIGAYVQPLCQGNLALPFELRDEIGRRVSLFDDHLSGRYLFLLFVNSEDKDQLRGVFDDIAKLYDRVKSAASELLVISSGSDAQCNQELRNKSGLKGSILGDSTGAIFASYGLHKGNDVALRLVLLTPYRQVRNWSDGNRLADLNVDGLMQDATEPRGEASWSTEHAPVLMVPNVLSKRECGELIEAFEGRGPFTVRAPRPGEFDGDYKIPVYEHNRQDRVDHIIRDQATLQFLDSRIFGRVTPMIKKAFAFDVTRREDLHIARYVGERGGNKMGHRDNTSAATAYRRFALSMSLNDDYDGGEVVFREFNDCGYRPAAGTALVFASSLLHEVQETTRGVRYNLISHFFNEQTIAK